MSDEREILSWELFGEASRTLAQMVADDGTQFDAHIPAFVLSTPRTLH